MTFAAPVDAAPAGKTTGKTIGINVVLNGDVTADRVKALEVFGKVQDRIEAIDALAMRAREADLDAIRSLPFVASANPDAERHGAPVDTVAATDFSRWPEHLGPRCHQRHRLRLRQPPRLLTTAAACTWRCSTPACSTPGASTSRRSASRPSTRSRSAVAAGKTATSPSSPTSGSTTRTRTARTSPAPSSATAWAARPSTASRPMATVIPVKVLNQNGSGWSSVIARGITYVADLKAGPLAGSPVVINMSLGGSVLDGVEKAAIDYAISKGVIIVASAGNRGTAAWAIRAPTRRSSRSRRVVGLTSGRLHPGGERWMWPIRWLPLTSISRTSPAANCQGRTSTWRRRAPGWSAPTRSTVARRATTTSAAPAWPRHMWPASSR